jgi:hypothetical protein
LEDEMKEMFDTLASEVFFSIILVVATTILLSALEYFLSRKSKAKSQQRITQAEAKVTEQPEKVRPAWDLARVTLDSYFNSNLRQINYIFWLSVAVMTVGFSILMWGIVQAMNKPDNLSAAILATVAGIITEFIGATFLIIYKSTVQQAIDYSKSLERINSIGMAMQILDTMPDETSDRDLKSKTKAVLVELLARQGNEVSNDNRKD